MIGDVTGYILFILPKEHEQKLVYLTKKAMAGRSDAWNDRQGIAQSAFPTLKNREFDVSVINEIGNIIAEVYLGAIHDFSRLNIYHTIPTLVVDMVQSLMDETIATLSRRTQTVIAIENEFFIDKEDVKNYLLLIPHVESIGIIVDSVEQVKKAFYP